MFDLSAVKPQEEPGTIPDGKYMVVCSDAVLKDTKAGTGKVIVAKFKIKTGVMRGQEITEFYNVENPNPTAVKIGKEGLVNFFKNSNYSGDYKWETPNDAAVEMFGLTVGVVAQTKPSTNPEYGPRTSVKRYFDVSSEAAAIPAKPASPASVAPAPEDDIGF